MPYFESEHPLGRDVAKIYAALNEGVIDIEAEELPNPNIKLNYTKPDDSAVGVGTLRIADWKTEDVTKIFYPVEVDMGNMDWQALLDDGFEPVRQRIHTRDLFGRPFSLTLDGKPVLSPYVQFDVLDEGVLLAVEDEGKQLVTFGRYESANYDLYNVMAHHYSSVLAVLKLADAA